MAKLISVKRKKRGRPATGTDPLMGFRAAPEIRGRIVHWAENQPDHPSLSEALRRLVEMGLSQAKQPGPRVLSTSKEAAARAAELAAKPIAKPGRRARARELAGDAIEKMADTTASPEERDQRRRRLTKGPTEFREARVDQPKRKG
jgi:hypothetical protein